MPLGRLQFGAVRSDNPEQLRYRHIGAVFRHQPCRIQPPAPLTAAAGHVEHLQSGGNLAEEDYAWAGGRCWLAAAVHAKEKRATDETGNGALEGGCVAAGKECGTTAQYSVALGDRQQKMLRSTSIENDLLVRKKGRQWDGGPSFHYIGYLPT